MGSLQRFGLTADFCGTTVALSPTTPPRPNLYVVTTPAKPAGPCAVTVHDAAGQVDATPISYLYVAAPVFSVVRATAPSQLTLYFGPTLGSSPPVVRRVGAANAFAPSDMFVTVNGVPRDVAGDAVGSSFSVSLAGPGLAPGDVVYASLTVSGAAKLADEAGVSPTAVGATRFHGVPL